MGKVIKTLSKWVLIPVFLIALVSVLLGSLPSTLFGKSSLNINGSAPIVAPEETSSNATGWPQYGGSYKGDRYSSAGDITAENVSSLQIAWQYQSGDATIRPPEEFGKSALEVTPILARDKLVYCTPFNEVIALDPATGKEIWRFDPELTLNRNPANQYVCRGVSLWHDASASEGASCADRIFMGTNDARLFALDATTGLRCNDFGENGEVSVAPEMELVWPGEFQVTSPPVVVGGTVVIGSSISDNVRVDAPKGTVRAFDAVTGEPRWSFDPIPRDASNPAYESWAEGSTKAIGHANVWAPLAVDSERGLVFLPTSSASPDFYGGLRIGDNRYSNSVVALNGATGEVVWSFQTVHHDVWDYDLPSQPVLSSVWRDGTSHDVVIQVTKMGLVFVLDRETGEPFLPIEERPVPQSTVQGEQLSPTQPFPVNTPPIVPSRLSPDDAFGLTYFDKAVCRDELIALDANGLYMPPSEKGLLLYPFNGGGANWGGAAYDPTRNLLVVPMMNMAHSITVIPEADIKAVQEVTHDAEIGPQKGAAFGVKRKLLLSPLGLPCTPPPWGVLAGVDISSGEIVWRHAVGTTEDLAGGLAMPLGVPVLGGPMITSGGLVFLAGTVDDYLRAFDTATGIELWKGRLPAGGQATPMTYVWQGRQYVVIAAGGHSTAGTKLGDYIVAFALPE